jgi:hypothetical protein
MNRFSQWVVACLAPQYEYARLTTLRLRLWGKSRPATTARGNHAPTHSVRSSTASLRTVCLLHQREWVQHSIQSFVLPGPFLTPVTQIRQEMPTIWSNDVVGTGLYFHDHLHIYTCHRRTSGLVSALPRARRIIKCNPFERTEVARIGTRDYCASPSGLVK